MIILDTNVISELMKPEPDKAVVNWVASSLQSSLYTTSINRAEILFGIMRLPSGKKRDAFESAARAMFDEDLGGRILAFSSDAAYDYAQIASSRIRAGRPISHFDAQIAAIARINGAKVATRNIKDFQSCAVDLIDPWQYQKIF